jgi:hypothetical protein
LVTIEINVPPTKEARPTGPKNETPTAYMAVAALTPVPVDNKLEPIFLNVPLPVY